MDPMFFFLVLQPKNHRLFVYDNWYGMLAGLIRIIMRNLVFFYLVFLCIFFSISPYLSYKKEITFETIKDTIL